MIRPILVALGLTSVTVLIHAFGTLEVVRHLARAWQRRKEPPGFLAAEIQIVRAVAVLLALHLVEATVWACVYWLSKEVPDLETAVYFSLTSYTTMGYGDVVLLVPWRLLGPIEGAVGILMFGWSTAILVAAITRIHGSRLRLQAETPAD